MSLLVDLTGRTYGLLTVTGMAGKSRTGHLLWSVSCQCGGIKVVHGTALKGGGTRSCGCLEAANRRRRVELNTTHGRSSNGGSRTYHIWCHIRQRCNNPASRFYYLYGGRGIQVCQRWRESFENFVEDMGECPKGRSIDRFPDKNGNYEKNNCRWANSKEQANNRNCRSDAYLVTAFGRTQNVVAWAREYGFAKSTLLCRLYNGWSAERALSCPVARNKRNGGLLSA